jgi:hypothetical protein
MPLVTVPAFVSSSHIGILFSSFYDFITSAYLHVQIHNADYRSERMRAYTPHNILRLCSLLKLKKPFAEMSACTQTGLQIYDTYL